MKRLFWVAVGATLTVVVLRKASAVSSRLAPDNVGRQVLGAVRQFTGDVRAGMTEREQQLQSALGIGPDGAAAPTSRQLEGEH